MKNENDKNDQNKSVFSTDDSVWPVYIQTTVKPVQCNVSTFHMAGMPSRECKNEYASV